MNLFLFFDLRNICNSYFRSEIFLKLICHLNNITFIWKFLKFFWTLIKVTYNVFCWTLIFIQLVDVLKNLLILQKELLFFPPKRSCWALKCFWNKCILASVDFVPFVWFNRHDWAFFTDVLKHFIVVFCDEVAWVHADYRPVLIVTYFVLFGAEKILAHLTSSQYHAWILLRVSFKYIFLN